MKPVEINGILNGWIATGGNMGREESIEAMGDLLVEYTKNSGEVVFSEVRGQKAAVVSINGKTILINLDALYDTVLEEERGLRLETKQAILELRLFQIVDRLDADALAPSVYLTL